MLATLIPEGSSLLFEANDIGARRTLSLTAVRRITLTGGSHLIHFRTLSAAFCGTTSARALCLWQCFLALVGLRFLFIFSSVMQQANIVVLSKALSLLGYTESS